jgi:uncharacterized protein YndB with AHSA1/START domain
MPICKVIEFNVPPERVFPWVADAEKNRQWLPNGESTVFTGDPARMGATFVQRIKEGGRVNEYGGEVTGYAKDRWYAIRMNSRSFSVAVEYRFEPTETNGTKLTFTCDVLNPNFVVKAFMFVFSGFTKMILQKPMEKLKALAEGVEPGRGGWGRGPGI